MVPRKYCFVSLKSNVFKEVNLLFMKIYANPYLCAFKKY